MLQIVSALFGASLLGASFPLAAHAAKTTSASSASPTGTFTNARFTFYDAGLGACGETNTASDFIVALNSQQYGNGEYCKKEIDITYNGKTHTATIMDDCPGCPYGGLDFSRGLFDYFADESVGVITGSWSFTDGSGATNTKSNGTSTGKIPTGPATARGFSPSGSGDPSLSSVPTEEPSSVAGGFSSSIPHGFPTTLPGDSSAIPPNPSSTGSSGHAGHSGHSSDSGSHHHHSDCGCPSSPSAV
ncbi:hypothetical protein M0805_002514 [Coniferiporia weirii]|nr:hypothetical protein M0805_002514 [Coniferiporia weirii]